MERSEATDGYRDSARHATADSRIEKDPPAGYRADIDQPRWIVALPAATEPQVTNVTAAATVRVAIGDDERIAAGMLLEPLPRPIVEYDHEFVHHAIMARRGRPRVVASNGPDLRVYLSTTPASADRHGYDRHHVDLGALNGNLGNQNYSLPDSVDLTRYRSAVIWCRQFKVGFAVTPLTA